MCSILLTNKEIHNFDQVNYYLKFRGPDDTSTYHQGNITFVHNLLSICGEFTPQPFIENQIVAMHNGEIYNYGDYKSDGYSLIPKYNEYGELFTTQLDGEFAVALVDFLNDTLILSTDVFATKPLWYAIDGDKFGVSSYRTPLENLGFVSPIKIPANTILKINLKTLEVVNLGEVYTFDLHQHKTNFDDWTSAFEEAIYKRTHKVREKIFIGLSSGYDSGALACELSKQSVEYNTYTVLGKENEDILRQRIKENAKLIQPTQFLYELAHNHIESKVEQFQYTICSSSSDYNEKWLRLHDDSGSNGLSVVCSNAINDGIKIYLSGMGADEIFSDYGFQGNKIYPHSNFGGLYPDDLSTIFPWNSFYGSSMESYLAKEEYVSGSYGIEGRYPFLDKNVVQEFLWLSAELKNSQYKSVLDNYLTENKYPYEKNRKIGF